MSINYDKKVSNNGGKTL